VTQNFIPIQPILTGPGSQPGQPGDEDWSCLPLPAEVETYRAPPLPEPGEPGADAVRQLLRRVVDAYQADPDPARTLSFALDRLDAPAHRLLAQVLAEGEVSARIVLPEGGSVEIQESRYPGVWRVVTLGAHGQRQDDRIEVGAIPAVVLEQAAAAPVGARIPPTEGYELMNAPAIANEIAAAHMRAVEAAGAITHTVNFSLLPLSPGDTAWLEAMLGEGNIGLFSTGYGKCMVMATTLRHVWRVRYSDGVGKVLLDTVEITRIPEVVLAAPDDLSDSMEHLRQIIDWLEPR
jgi:hydrogenase-1 operon protein HyaF